MVLWACMYAVVIDVDAYSDVDVDVQVGGGP